MPGKITIFCLREILVDYGSMKNIMYLFSFLMIMMSVTSEVAFAGSVTFYKIDKAPSAVAGILRKGDGLYLVFGESRPDDWDGADINKILKLAQGKKICGKINNLSLNKNSDEDVYVVMIPCVKTTKSSNGSYVLDVVIGYDYEGWDLGDKRLMAEFKRSDYVKERRFRMIFSFNRAKCSANVTQRSYVALDGSKQIPARTGELECSVKG